MAGSAALEPCNKELWNLHFFFLGPAAVGGSPAMLRAWGAWAWRGCGLCVFLAAVSARAADEFAPPKVERDVVAAVGKAVVKINVDREYRITDAILGSEASNDDLKALASCERLTTISISSPKVTNDGLEHLKGLKKLISIVINGTDTTEAGIAALRTALPGCRVTSIGRVLAERPQVDRSGRQMSRTVMLLRRWDIQDNLKLTDDQKMQFRTAFSNDFMEWIEEKAIAVLTSSQKIRLKQIELQQSASSILRPDVVKQLKLSAEQVSSIRKVHEEHATTGQAAQRAVRGQGELREKTAELNKQRDEKIQAVLNDEQKKALQEMLGPPANGSGYSLEQFSREFFSPAAVAKSIFDIFDKNKDNELSDAEFPESAVIRGEMKAAGITLVFPVAREVFETNYAKFYERSRSGR